MHSGFDADSGPGERISRLGMDLDPPDHGQNCRQNAQNMSFDNISNLYKELGYDSTHHFGIVARSLYNFGDRWAIPKITTLIGKP